MAAFPKYNFTHIATNTTTVVSKGTGTLHSLVINTTAAGAITLYDSTSGGGTVIAILPSSAVVGTYLYDVVFSVGLTVVTAAASDITVSIG